MHFVLGVDIGGSHVSAALINTETLRMVPGSFRKVNLCARGSVAQIIGQWSQAIHESLEHLDKSTLKGIGIAMPGPFDYTKGICLMEGVDKYQSLYGVNVRHALKSALKIEAEMPICFENDAACFGLGESVGSSGKVIAITIGTGFGSTFINDGVAQTEGYGVPPGGVLYNQPYEAGVAEDYISSRGLLRSYQRLSGKEAGSVKEMAANARKGDDVAALEVFRDLGCHLARCLSPWLQSYGAEQLVIGGNIAHAADLFLHAMEQEMEQNHISVHIKISEQMEQAAILGAAMVVQKTVGDKGSAAPVQWRKSSQPLLPQLLQRKAEQDAYDMYPYRSLAPGSINIGYDSLARWISGRKVVAIDGFYGNDWDVICKSIAQHLQEQGISVLWIDAAAFLKEESAVDAMTAPFLGAEDDVWGTKTSLSLTDFFQLQKIDSLEQDTSFDVTIYIGVGAALLHKKAPVIYIDLPKNELQYRMRAGSATNIGTQQAATSYANKYKRSYFVDWVVLSKHRQQIKDRIAVVADGQWRDDISWAQSTSIQEGLHGAAHNVVRVRPWFEAGAWGGQWMKKHIPSLNQDEINYAWSFELIVPENGVVFESDGRLLEVAFDWLMEAESKAVLGSDAAVFGLEFPIRFDFLDTFDGGNLSIQCHPRLKYIQEQFGETITQDETYYILDCKTDAGVYLGFQENINPQQFKNSLEKSYAENVPVDIEQYVQLHPAHKHDLFLIPNGTIHSSGVNNLVLEISATPYIFTFKMYDWLRLDLDGQPRPINIERAFANLDFERKGNRVKQELISQPVLLQQEEHYQLIHLPTHKDHFFDVHRMEFTGQVHVQTEDKCHVLMLVEGTSIIVVTNAGERHRFHYAETFVIPAAAVSYELINEDKAVAKVIKAFVK